MESQVKTIDEVKLLGMWSSPFVRRVQWALAMKGIEYEYVEEDLLNKSPTLLQHNPVHKQVPVLLHNGRAIVESSIIIEYIDQTWKHNPILPRDPRERAMAHFWARYVEDEILGAVMTAFFTVGEEQRKAVATAAEALGQLEEEFRGKMFLGGYVIGFADLVAGWMGHWLGVVEEVLCVKIMDQERFPWIAEWMGRLVQDPVIKNNLPIPARMHELYDMLRKIGLQSCDGK